MNTGRRGSYWTRLQEGFLRRPRHPPQGGIFEHLQAIEFPDRSVRLRGDLKRGAGKGWVYNYNLRHNGPAAGDNLDALTEYLTKLLVEAIFEIDLRQSEPHLFAAADLDSPLRVAHVIAEKTADVMFDFYGGASSGSSS